MTTVNPSSNGRAFGVRGIVANATPGANFGVWGELLGSNNGTAILGWDRKRIPGWGQLLSGLHSWAGYFIGDVHITHEVGIGTLDPSAKLHIADGDIYIEDIGQGVIMKSPNGNCWRYVPGNSGKLNGELITCPNE